MPETAVMEAMVVTPVMVQVVMAEMEGTAIPEKAAMVVTGELVFSIRVETEAMAVMGLKAEAKEAVVVQVLWGKEVMDKTARKNKGLNMKNKLVSTMLFGLAIMTSISITACDTKECSQESNTSESTRAKDGEHGADGSGNVNGQDGGHGQKGVLGQDGGHGGNGGNSDLGKGGDGGNGGDVD